MANKNKATHIGECQVCGRIQKLPKGQLSKHGYTKQWGFFNGTCWGAEHLPFEQSIDLIEGAIKQANEQCAKLAVESESLKAGTFFAGPTIWTSVYVPATWQNRRSSYQWVKAEVSKEDRSYTHEGQPRSYPVFYVTRDGKREKYDNYNLNIKDVSEVCLAANKAYAEQYLDKSIADLSRYVAWQKERIKDWKPRELKPVVD